MCSFTISCCSENNTKKRKLSNIQFPNTKLKNLIACESTSWTVDGDNWHPKLTKTVNIVNNYFDDILSTSKEEDGTLK